MSNTNIPTNSPKSSKDLRDLALKAKDSKSYFKTENPQMPDLDPSEVQEITMQLAEMILSSAKEGYFEFTYNVEHYSENSIEAINQDLRSMYAHIMIVRDFGKKQVTISWAENI